VRADGRRGLAGARLAPLEQRVNDELGLQARLARQVARLADHGVRHALLARRVGLADEEQRRQHGPLLGRQARVGVDGLDHGMSVGRAPVALDDGAAAVHRGGLAALHFSGAARCVRAPPARPCVPAHAADSAALVSPWRLLARLQAWRPAARARARARACP
jgi:hypothetical protein